LNWVASTSTAVLVAALYAAAPLKTQPGVWAPVKAERPAPQLPEAQGVPVQAPPWQESAEVHALPSSQGVLFGAAGFEQSPVPGLQVPATWHWSLAAQITGAPPRQAPAWQVSPCVQALPSVQAVPFAAAGFEQEPVPGSHAPATWHWSAAAQTTGLWPTQAPLWQVSVFVQALPSLQAAPSGAAGFEHSPVLGSQAPAAWH
jgi:hypothetical protein